MKIVIGSRGSALALAQSELVREKIFIHTNDEVPHSISCKLIGYEEEKDIVKIYIDIERGYYNEYI